MILKTIEGEPIHEVATFQFEESYGDVYWITTTVFTKKGGITHFVRENPLTLDDREVLQQKLSRSIKAARKNHEKLGGAWPT